MPFYLDAREFESEASQYGSALIVVCNFCPAASLSLREGRPYLEPFRRLWRTGSLERHVSRVRRRLEDAGTRTAVFRGGLANFIVCMWTDRKRRQLLELARRYEALVVLGCDTAFESIRELVAPAGCCVIRGMDCEGAFDVVPRLRAPCNVSLDLVHVTPLVRKQE